MATKLSVSATGDGPGTVPFSIGQNGKLTVSPAPETTAPVEQTTPPETPVDITPPTPFARMFPGVDPAKVEMFEDKGRIKFRMAPEAPADNQQDGPAPVQTPVPATPAAPADNDIAHLRAELAKRDELMVQMAQAMSSGKPLSEFLGLTAPVQTEPDYSHYDLYDDAQRAEFVKQLRKDALATARAEVQAAMQPHQGALASARQQQEYGAVRAKSAADPDFDRKAALATQLIGNSPNVSFEATYNLVSTIWGAKPASTPQAAAIPSGAANQAKTTTLTSEQQEQKARQAARLPQSNGVRGAGKAVPPESLKKTRDLLIWGMHQDALGNL